MPRIIPIGIALIKRVSGSIGVSACLTARLYGSIGVSANVYDRASGSVPLTGDVSDSDLVFFGPSTMIRRDDGAKI